MTDARRVALVASTTGYVGPDLARSLAARGHDLVIGDPVDGLVDELTGLGATVQAVTGVHDLASLGSATALVEAAVSRFGRIDSAVAATGRIVVGRFLKSSVEDLRAAVVGCLEAPYNFLRAVVPEMVAKGEGQVLVITSASAVRPTPGAPLYSSARAGANMLVRNVADEIASTGVQVNSVGTNFMDFPEFLAASNATTPEGRARVEALVPMGRLGTMQEFASFCMPYLDGTSRFTTGQFVAYAGGWA
jgi:3-oxoacyl-[acyl-carrier protein] reductase